MTETLLKVRASEKRALVDQGESDAVLKPLTVWTSTRLRTVETAKYLHEKGYAVRQRSQLSQLNPGVCEKMSEQSIRQEFPDEVAKHEIDPYHHRYPRAEVCATVVREVAGFQYTKIEPSSVISRSRCSTGTYHS